MFWSKASLSDIGLVVNLAHGAGVCPYPQCSERDMHIIDTNGIFITKVRFCSCAPRSRFRCRALHPTASQWLVPVHDQDSEYLRNLQMPRLRLPSK